MILFRSYPNQLVNVSFRRLHGRVLLPSLGLVISANRGDHRRWRPVIVKSNGFICGWEGNWLEELGPYLLRESQKNMRLTN